MKAAEAIIFMMGCINPQECRQSVLDAYDSATRHSVVMSSSDPESEVQSMEFNSADKKEED